MGVAVGVGETTAVVTTVEDGFCGTAVVLGIGVEAKQKKRLIHYSIQTTLMLQGHIKHQKRAGFDKNKTD